MAVDDVRQKLLGKFREVTAERVERISSKLLELERGASADARQEVARELHTLKGEAGMMGFAGISRVAHAAEDLLAALSPGGEDPALDALLAACDSIPSFLDGPSDGGEMARALAESLRSMAGEGRPSDAPAAAPAPAAPAPSAATRLPAPPAEPPPREPQAAEQRSASIRVDVERLDEIAALAGDVLVEGNRGRARTGELANLFSRWSRVADGLLAAAEELRGPGGALPEPLETDLHLLRSDTFRFLRRHSDAQAVAHAQLAQLAETVGAARLVPLSGVLAGLPRAARDLAKEQGKRLACEVEGGETCVDKAILLSLQDPLVHLLRNAVDHGLEEPEERERAGKPPQGRLVVTARADGDVLTVTVEDDGRGIRHEDVRAVAVRKGFLDERRAAALSDRAAIELIFLSGFSTRDRAGETSGRGVGLDVVRKRVVALGGSVMVDSTPGKGTRFTLRMSQSLSLMKVLLVRVDDDVYGLPAIDVLSVGRLDPADLTEVAGVRAVRERGRLMPVACLGEVLGLGGGPRQPRPATAFLWQGSEGLAVTVDGMYGEREVAVKSSGAFVKGMRLVSGAALLEDGRVALLLSTGELLAAARRLATTLEAGRGRGRRLRILLVDDSVIARDTEAAMLASLGHEVDQARDGEEAWQKLQAGDYQALVSDVQMPALDGIGLTRRARATPRLAGLPIVILSSLSAPEEKRRGVDAGADAYLVKGELDVQSLAATLDRLCGAGG